MSSVLRNVVAVVGGLVVGGLLNMSIVTFGPVLIPPPAGVNVDDLDSLAKGMHLFEAKHFIAPFLAHALGTLVGALVTFLIAASRNAQLAYLIGALNFCGGVAACFLLPAPLWFMALDVLLAYFPMAWLAIQIGRKPAYSKPTAGH